MIYFLLDLWCTKRKYFDCFYLKLFKSEAAFCSCSIRCSADVFLWILRYYYEHLFHRSPPDSQLLITRRLISLCYMQSLETHCVDSTLKRRGNIRFHFVSTWNPHGVFVVMFSKCVFCFCKINFWYAISIVLCFFINTLFGRLPRWVKFSGRCI